MTRPNDEWGETIRKFVAACDVNNVGRLKMNAHPYNRECPACGGKMCQHVRVNSLVPYEEIAEEVG